MTVLMISPGYPAEMAFFTRGLGQAGVRVIGLGDQSPDALPAEAKGALDHYVHTGSRTSPTTWSSAASEPVCT